MYFIVPVLQKRAVQPRAGGETFITIGEPSGNATVTLKFVDQGSVNGGNFGRIHYYV